jgi:hypothetical protein
MVAKMTATTRQYTPATIKLGGRTMYSKKGKVSRKIQT